MRIVLDDFGTALSSLSSLHRVLVQATLMAARSLGMDPQAEGVETNGQAAALNHLRCGSALGFQHTRPQRADGLESWLLAR